MRSPLHTQDVILSDKSAHSDDGRRRPAVQDARGAYGEAGALAARTLLLLILVFCTATLLALFLAGADVRRSIDDRLGPFSPAPGTAGTTAPAAGM